MGFLGKDQILTQDDLKKEELFIPEWSGKVLVSEISGDARDELEQFMANESQKSKEGQYAHIRAALVAATLVDEKGNRLFTLQDAMEIGRKNGQALDRIFDVANKLNKIYGAEREDLEKNSETPQADFSDGE